MDHPNKEISDISNEDVEKHIKNDVLANLPSEIKTEVETENENFKPVVLSNKLYFGGLVLKGEETDNELYNEDVKFELRPSLGTDFKEQHDSSNIFSSVFIKQEMSENDFSSLGSEQPVSENVSVPVESENQMRYENELIDEWNESIKEENIHVKSEDEYSSIMALSGSTDYRNSRDGVSENFKRDERSLQVTHKANLKMDMFTPGNTEKFKCDRSFHRKRSNLKKDKKVHTDLTETECSSHEYRKELIMFKCDQCSFQTIYKSNLKKHAIIHKSAEEAPMFKCNQCSYQTVHKYNLRIHALTHKSPEELPMFKCNQCSYQTIRKNSLRLHAITHKSTAELTMFKCYQCSYKTIRKGCLRRHVITHINVENICSQSKRIPLE